MGGRKSKSRGLVIKGKGGCCTCWNGSTTWTAAIGWAPRNWQPKTQQYCSQSVLSVAILKSDESSKEAPSCNVCEKLCSWTEWAMSREQDSCALAIGIATANTDCKITQLSKNRAVAIRQQRAWMLMTPIDIFLGPSPVIVMFSAKPTFLASRLVNELKRAVSQKAAPWKTMTYTFIGLLWSI